MAATDLLHCPPFARGQATLAQKPASATNSLSQALAGFDADGFVVPRSFHVLNAIILFLFLAECRSCGNQFSRLFLSGCRGVIGDFSV